MMDKLGSSELTLMFVFLGLFIIPVIFFLIVQQNTLKTIKQHNRKMQPGEVWLQLIPIFNIIWQFVVITRISDSIKNEINDRNANSFLGIADPAFANDINKRPTYNIGLAFCILGCSSIIPSLGGYASIASLICWVFYWIQLTGYKNKFTSNPV